MPTHMAGAVAPAAACPANVNQRKAPGAMSAIAFIVRPVSPRVACIFGASSAISILLRLVVRALVVLLLCAVAEGACLPQVACRRAALRQSANFLLRTGNQVRRCLSSGWFSVRRFRTQSPP